MFSDNFSKRKFWRFLNKKLTKIVNRYHVFSVLSILFDEIIKDLKDGKEIKIHNFGEIRLSKSKPRSYHDLRFRKVMTTNGNSSMKFSLSKKIKKRLCKSIDHDSTFKKDLNDSEK